MVDFVAEQPERRAGIGQIFLNDVDDAIEDVKWCHANGLRGGVLISSVPPTCDWIKPLYHPDHDPAVGGVRRPRRAGQRAQRHRRAQVPARLPRCRSCTSSRSASTRSARSSTSRSAACSSDSRSSKFVMTEMGCAWIPPTLTHLDTFMANMRSNKVGEMRFDGETVPPRSATEYFHQNCYVGASQPTPADIAGRARPRRRRALHVGQRLPARRRAPTPSPVRRCARRCRASSPNTVQRMLAGTAAELYGFDLDKLRPHRGSRRPDGRRGRDAAHLAAGRTQPGAPTIRRPTQGQLTTRWSSQESVGDFFSMSSRS